MKNTLTIFNPFLFEVWVVFCDLKFRLNNSAMATTALTQNFFVQPEEQEAYALRLFHRFPAPWMSH